MPGDLEARFDRAFFEHLGQPQDKFARQAVTRMLARKLAAHFDVAGWPPDEELQVYVREAIERYG